MRTKICTKCGQVFPATTEFFYKRETSTADGYRNPCKKCHSEYAKKYRKLHKDELNEYSRVYYSEHKDRIIEQKKKYQKNNKEK